MRRWFLIGAGLLAACAAAPARADMLAPMLRPLIAPALGLLCRQAVDAAERSHAIPPHLLSAIALVESGRKDPETGGFSPWPWTVNAEGEGHFYATKAEAIAAVHALQARGVNSIDVGCLQVNLMHHPHAFTSLDQAFDPNANADYAAQFLTQLHGQAGDWTRAAAQYHSMTPELAFAYQRKVVAAWTTEQQGLPVQPGNLLLAAADVAPMRPAGGVRGAFPRLQMSHTPSPHVIPMAAPPAGGGASAIARGMAAAASVSGAAAPGAMPGRGLNAYRAHPVAMATSAPVALH